jgi:hypothetical protein
MTKDKLPRGGMTEKSTGKTKAHTIYRLTDEKGTRVPGVTTIISILNKPALVPWANKMGLQGIDTNKYVDEKAAIGSLAHNMILGHLLGVEPDLSDNTPNQIELAENSLLKYWEWENKHTIEVIAAEAPMVSNAMQYGGTVDLLCKMDGEITLVDFKTGGGIYSEMGIQLAAYLNLVMECLPGVVDGQKLGASRILRIGRDDSEGFEERSFPDLRSHFEIFQHCLAIYQLQKKI